MPTARRDVEVTEYRFSSLEDFLVSRRLTLDTVTEDGWGASFPIKGRTIEATILFADISNFSGRTQALSSMETLAFVNHFFSWITAEALMESRGIVDKYIGDEVMLVFSQEFGSGDPFAEAVTVARRFGENDAFDFSPHIGIAAGEVTIGFVGTPVKYNCSAFGRPVAVAARCAGARRTEKIPIGASIVIPAADWDGRNFGDLFPPRRRRFPDGDIHDQPTTWEMKPREWMDPKNMPRMEVVRIENSVLSVPSITAEEWARKAVAEQGA